MTNEELDKKAVPARTSKKSDGWREREEAMAAGVTPRINRDRSDRFATF
jgi:hypothetical protein